ncbi:MAG: cytochrome c family protein [Hyphomicrobiales bacterium]|nr:cytochrome c family protein [Hyphomicrobiales bacterium]
MRYDYPLVALVLSFAFHPAAVLAAEDGDLAKGEQIFRACAACHSLTPKRHMTGPSLADIWDRHAGTAEGFSRYSQALRNSGIVWDADTLDAWLADTRALVPGNRMIFRGMSDAGQRRDLIAFLRQVSEHRRAQAPAPAQNAEQEPMAGQEEPMDLKAAPPANRVVSVRYCRDTYTVVSESGEAHEFWEFNLRIKTDGSDLGPAPNHPVLIQSGMMGDRAFLVFAAPAEINAFVSAQC